MLTMASFFFYFITAHISETVHKAGLLLMIGSLVFFASDNFLAHGKYDLAYQNIVSASTNSYLIMITYYAAQFMIAKGIFYCAVNLV